MHEVNERLIGLKNEARELFQRIENVRHRDEVFKLWCSYPFQFGRSRKEKDIQKWIDDVRSDKAVMEILTDVKEHPLQRISRFRAIERDSYTWTATDLLEEGNLDQETGQKVEQVIQGPDWLRENLDWIDAENGMDELERRIQAWIEDAKKVLSEAWTKAQTAALAQKFNVRR
ncbi:hypothetical protein MK805_02470 [Shimazuella sp. AN120528]|uniref:hypothetical protein n=1 Tax=Shimazuella soli TaxID=1892854 RepID=UPI001F0D1D00|nr:hypothetical protein [Shimazuella soli]MCH5583831.1 hypothetical protein [Shimazuella soli]